MYVPIATWKLAWAGLSAISPIQVAAHERTGSVNHVLPNRKKSGKIRIDKSFRLVIYKNKIAWRTVGTSLIY